LNRSSAGEPASRFTVARPNRIGSNRGRRLDSPDPPGAEPVPPLGAAGTDVAEPGTPAPPDADRRTVVLI
jgi:hypothetical protein